MEIGFWDFIGVLLKWGWVFLPILLFLVWKNLWMNYVRLKYDLSLNWIVLEIKIPQSVEKSPKSMEQVFTGIYSMRVNPNFIDKYIHGKHQPEISFEIVSIGGEIHFFIRTPDIYAPLIRSQFHSQYPEADIFEVEDYTFNLPADIPNKDYGMWGTELIFTKEDPYPIRTYKHFKEDVTVGMTPDGKMTGFVDPIAPLMEVLSGIKEGEQIWLHYMIRPAGDEWQKQGKELIDKILGKKKITKSNFIVEEVFEFFQDMVGILFGKVPEDRHREAITKQEEKKLTQGELELIKILEEGLSKHAFHTNIRILYIARNDVFTPANIPAILGTFNQFSSYNLNGFKPNGEVTPGVDYFFKNTRNYLRNRSLFRNARRKLFTGKGVILNVEELATVYHIPSHIVEAPSMPKVGAKTVQPPSHLPTI